MMPQFLIEDYNIVWGYLSEGEGNLPRKIKDLMDDGWVVWGTPYKSGNGHSQCMIKPITKTEHFDDENFSL